jgi:hypothetical protein
MICGAFIVNFGSFGKEWSVYFIKNAQCLTSNLYQIYTFYNLFYS